MPDCGFTGCCKEGGANQFQGEIQAAEDDLYRTRPDLFNPDGSIAVSDQEYTDVLAARIVQMTNGAVCSEGASGSTSRDEIRVKRDNGLSQHVDVTIGSNGKPWVGDVFTCRPASF